MKKLITMIVPVYNAEQYLDVCIKSLVDQTYRDLEIILINDGSTDKSGDICEVWAKKDSRIRYYYQENRGVGAARNRGLREARGEYISFVDADDFLCEDFCYRMVDILIGQNVDIVHCEAIHIFEDGRSEIKGKKSLLTYTCKSTEYEYCTIKGHTVVWGAMYTRNVLDGLLFPEDLYVGEDTVFFAMAVHNAKNLVYYDAALYYYRMIKVSLYRGPFDSRKYTQLEAWKRICQIFDDWPLTKLSAQKQLAETCNYMIGRYLFDPEFDKKVYRHIRQTYRLNVWKAIHYYVMKRENPFNCIVKGMFPHIYALYFKLKWH